MSLVGILRGFSMPKNSMATQKADAPATAPPRTTRIISALASISTAIAGAVVPIATTHTITAHAAETAAPFYAKLDCYSNAGTVVSCPGGKNYVPITGYTKTTGAVTDIKQPQGTAPAITSLLDGYTVTSAFFEGDGKQGRLALTGAQTVTVGQETRLRLTTDPAQDKVFVDAPAAKLQDGNSQLHFVVKPNLAQYYEVIYKVDATFNNGAAMKVPTVVTAPGYSFLRTEGEGASQQIIGHAYYRKGTDAQFTITGNRYSTLQPATSGLSLAMVQDNSDGLNKTIQTWQLTGSSAGNGPYTVTVDTSDDIRLDPKVNHNEVQSKTPNVNVVVSGSNAPQSDRLGSTYISDNSDGNYAWAYTRDWATGQGDISISTSKDPTNSATDRINGVKTDWYNGNYTSTFFYVNDLSLQTSDTGYSRRFSSITVNTNPQYRIPAQGYTPNGSGVKDQYEGSILAGINNFGNPETSSSLPTLWPAIPAYTGGLSGSEYKKWADEQRRKALQNNRVQSFTIQQGPLAGVTVTQKLEDLAPAQVTKAGGGKYTLHCNESGLDDALKAENEYLPTPNDLRDQRQGSYWQTCVRVSFTNLTQKQTNVWLNRRDTTKEALINLNSRGIEVAGGAAAKAAEARTLSDLQRAGSFEVGPFKSSTDNGGWKSSDNFTYLGMTPGENAGYVFNSELTGTQMKLRYQVLDGYTAPTAATSTYTKAENGTMVTKQMAAPAQVSFTDNNKKTYNVLQSAVPQADLMQKASSGNYINGGSNSITIEAQPLDIPVTVDYNGGTGTAPSGLSVNPINNKFIDLKSLAEPGAPEGKKFNGWKVIYQVKDDPVGTSVSTNTATAVPYDPQVIPSLSLADLGLPTHGEFRRVYTDLVGRPYVVGLQIQADWIDAESTATAPYLYELHPYVADPATDLTSADHPQLVVKAVPGVIVSVADESKYPATITSGSTLYNRVKASPLATPITTAGVPATDSQAQPTALDTLAYEIGITAPQNVQPTFEKDGQLTFTGDVDPNTHLVCSAAAGTQTAATGKSGTNTTTGKATVTDVPLAAGVTTATCWASDGTATSAPTSVTLPARPAAPTVTKLIATAADHATLTATAQQGAVYDAGTTTDQPITAGTNQATTNVPVAAGGSVKVYNKTAAGYSAPVSVTMIPAPASVKAVKANTQTSMTVIVTRAANATATTAVCTLVPEANPAVTQQQAFGENGTATFTFTTGVSAVTTGVHCEAQETVAGVLVQSWQTASNQLIQQLPSPTVFASAYTNSLRVTGTTASEGASYQVGTGNESKSGNETAGTRDYDWKVSLAAGQTVTGAVYQDNSARNVDSKATTQLTIPAAPTSAVATSQDGKQVVKLVVPAGAGAYCYVQANKPASSSSAKAFNDFGPLMQQPGVAGQTELVLPVPAGTTGVLDCVSVNQNAQSKAISPAKAVTIPPAVTNPRATRVDDTITFAVDTAPLAGSSIVVKDSAGKQLCEIAAGQTSCTITDNGDPQKFADITPDDVTFTAKTGNNEGVPATVSVPGNAQALTITGIDNSLTNPTVSVSGLAGNIVAIKNGENWAVLGQVGPDGTATFTLTTAELKALLRPESGTATISLRSQNSNTNPTATSTPATHQVPAAPTIQGYYGAEKTVVTEPVTVFGGAVQAALTAGSIATEDRTAAVKCRIGNTGDFVAVTELDLKHSFAGARNNTLACVTTSANGKFISQIAQQTTHDFAAAPVTAQTTAGTSGAEATEGYVKFNVDDSVTLPGGVKVHLSYQKCDGSNQREEKVYESLAAFEAAQVPNCANDQTISQARVWFENADAEHDDTDEQPVSVKTPLTSEQPRITAVVQYGPEKDKIKAVAPKAQDNPAADTFVQGESVVLQFRANSKDVTDPANAAQSYPRTGAEIAAAAGDLGSGSLVSVRVLDAVDYRTTSVADQVQIPGLVEPTRIALKDGTTKLTFSGLAEGPRVRCYAAGALGTDHENDGATWTNDTNGVVEVTGGVGQQVACQAISRPNGENRTETSAYTIEGPVVKYPAVNNLAAPTAAAVTRDATTGATAQITDPNTAPTKLCFSYTKADGQVDSQCLAAYSAREKELTPEQLAAANLPADATDVKFYVEDQLGNQSPEQTLRVPAKVSATATITSLTRDARSGAVTIKVTPSGANAGQAVQLLDEQGKVIATMPVNAQTLDAEVTFAPEKLGTTAFPASSKWSTRVVDQAENPTSFGAKTPATVPVVPQVTAANVKNLGPDAQVSFARGATITDYRCVKAGTNSPVFSPANGTITVPKAAATGVQCYQETAGLQSPYTAVLKNPVNVPEPHPSAQSSGDKVVVSIPASDVPARGQAFVTYTDPAGSPRQVPLKACATDPNRYCAEIPRSDIKNGNDPAANPVVNVVTQDAQGNQSDPVAQLVPPANDDQASITSVAQTGQQPVLSGQVAAGDDRKLTSNYVRLVDPATGKVATVVPVNPDGSFKLDAAQPPVAGADGVAGVKDPELLSTLLGANGKLKAEPVYLDPIRNLEAPGTASAPVTIPGTPEVGTPQVAKDGTVTAPVSPAHAGEAVRCRLVGSPGWTLATDGHVSFAAGANGAAATGQIECQAYVPQDKVDATDPDVALVTSPLSNQAAIPAQLAAPSVDGTIVRDGAAATVPLLNHADEAARLCYSYGVNPQVSDCVPVDNTAGAPDPLTSALSGLPAGATEVSYWVEDAAGNQSPATKVAVPAQNTDTATIKQVAQAGAQPEVTGSVAGKDGAQPTSNQVELLAGDGSVIGTVPVAADGTWSTAALPPAQQAQLAAAVAAGQTLTAVPVQENAAARSYGNPATATIPATPSITGTKTTATGAAVVSFQPGELAGSPDPHPVRCRVAAADTAPAGSWVTGTSPITVPDAAGRQVECQAYSDTAPAVESPVSEPANVAPLAAAPTAYGERTSATSGAVVAEKPAAGAHNVLRFTDQQGNLWELPFTGGTGTGDEERLNLPDSLANATLVATNPEQEGLPVQPELLADLNLESLQVVTVAADGNESAPTQVQLPAVNAEQAELSGVMRAGDEVTISGEVTLPEGDQELTSNLVELVDPETDQVVATVPVNPDGSWRVASAQLDDPAQAQAVRDLVASGRQLVAVPVAAQRDPETGKLLARQVGKQAAENLPSTPTVGQPVINQDGSATVTVTPGVAGEALRCRIVDTPGWTLVPETGVVTLDPAAGKEMVAGHIECQAYVPQDQVDPADPDSVLITSPFGTSAQVPEQLAAPQVDPDGTITREGDAAAVPLLNQADAAQQLCYSYGAEPQVSECIPVENNEGTPDPVASSLANLPAAATEVSYWVEDDAGNQSPAVTVTIPAKNNTTATPTGITRDVASGEVTVPVTLANNPQVGDLVHLLDQDGTVIASKQLTAADVAAGQVAFTKADAPAAAQDTWTSDNFAPAAQVQAQVIRPTTKAGVVVATSAGPVSDPLTVPAAPSSPTITTTGDDVTLTFAAAPNDHVKCVAAGETYSITGNTVTIPGAAGQDIHCYREEAGAQSPLAPAVNQTALPAPHPEVTGSSSHLTVRVPASDIPAGGTAQVSYLTPAGTTVSGQALTACADDPRFFCLEVARSAVKDGNLATAAPTFAVTVTDPDGNTSAPAPATAPLPVAADATITNIDRQPGTTPVVSGTSSAPYVRLVTKDSAGRDIVKIVKVNPDHTWSLPVPAAQLAAGDLITVQNVDSPQPRNTGTVHPSTIPATPEIGASTVAADGTATIPVALPAGSTLPAGGILQCRVAATGQQAAGAWTTASAGQVTLPEAAGQAVECRTLVPNSPGATTGITSPTSSPAQVPAVPDAPSITLTPGNPATATTGVYAPGETPVITVNGETLTAGTNYTLAGPDAAGNYQVTFTNPAQLAPGTKVEIQRQTPAGISQPAQAWVPNVPAQLKAVTAKDGSVTISGQVQPLVGEDAPAQIVAVETTAGIVYVNVDPETGKFSKTFTNGEVTPDTTVKLHAETGVTLADTGTPQPVAGLTRVQGAAATVTVPEKPEPVAKVGSTTGEAEPNTSVRITYLTADGPQSVIVEVNSEGEYTADLPGQIPGTSITIVTVRDDGSESAPVESLAPLATPKVPVDSANGAKGGVGSISGPAGDATKVTIDYYTLTGEKASTEVDVANGRYNLPGDKVAPGTPVTIVGHKDGVSSSPTIKLSPVEIEQFTAPANGAAGFISGVAATGSEIVITYFTVTGEQKTIRVTAENNSFSTNIPADAAPGSKVFARAVAYAGEDYEDSDEAEVEVPEVAPAQPIEVVHEPSSSDQARCVATSTDKIDLKWIIAGIGVLAAVGGIVWANSHGLIPSGSVDAQSSGFSSNKDREDEEDQDHAAGSSIALPQIPLPQLPQLPQLPDLSRIAPIGLGAALLALLVWNTNQCSSS